MVFVVVAVGPVAFFAVLFPGKESVVAGKATMV
jgi:hypothetical protein